MDQITEAVVNQQPTQPDETTTTSVLSSDQKQTQPQEQTVDFKSLIPKEYQGEKSLQNFQDMNGFNSIIFCMGDLLRGNDDQFKDLTFGYYTIQFAAWKLLNVSLFFRRIRKSIYHNICKSIFKNIPYIVLAYKIKY